MNNPQTRPLSLNELLLEARERYHGLEISLPPRHEWSDWYASYISSRQAGQTQTDAAYLATRYVLAGLAGGA